MHIRVLFIEDEAALAEVVKETLESKGFQVTHVLTLAEASAVLKVLQPHLILLDVMLPDGNGFNWLNSLRKKDQITPVILLTARSRTEDVVQGFEEGGNDYLKKPFSMAELVVRMKALLRKERQIAEASTDNYTWPLGAYRFHYPSGELIGGDNAVRQLTSREADILQLLLQQSQGALERTVILEKIWGNTDYFSGRSLDVFISKLRRYLSQDKSIKLINVRGIGYKLVY